MTENEIKGLKNLCTKLQRIKTKIEEQYNKNLQKEEKKCIKFKGFECYTHEDVDDVYRYDYCTSSECDKAHERLDDKKVTVGTDKYKVQISYLDKFLSDLYEEIRDEEFENQSDEEKRKYYKELEEYLEEQEKEKC